MYSGKCLGCGSDLTTGDFGNSGYCNICQRSKKSQPIGLQGWICPKCGAGLSPFTNRCPCVPYPQQGIGTGNI